ncbi:putative transcription factor interactor and regulator CCHC(Zn) family [Helianthus anomalus]
MVPKKFFKKLSLKGNAPVGRARKAGVRCFICKQFGHIASIFSSKYVNLSRLLIENDYIVKNTCRGRWGPIWVVDPSFKTYMIGNRNLFKVFKRHFGVLMNEKCKEFAFVHRIGEVRVLVDEKDKTIPCMFGDRAKGVDIFEDKSEEDLEQEYLDKFYENKDVQNGFLNEKAKWQEYVEEYYEKEFEIQRQRQKEKHEEGTSVAKKD